MVRYTEARFPPYRYIPGEGPHPTRNPDGHSYGRELGPIVIDERSWPGCEPYLFAIDLFNHGYYWEAHEQLEAIWIGAGPDTAVGMFAQGVIQAAAALLKNTMGKHESAARLAAAAIEKLRTNSAVLLGVDTRAFAAQLEMHLDGRRPDAPHIELRELRP